MSYPIVEKHIQYNYEAGPLKVQGVVVHSTATPNATAENEFNYFNGGDREASAHYFIDSTEIVRCVDENQIAWHAGPTSNNKFIGIELCEFYDSASFQEVWKRGVWLVADICHRYGFDTKSVFSHAETSAMYHETDHQDPIAYFGSHGKTVNQFRAEVQAALDALNQPKEVINMTKDAGQKLIAIMGDLYNASADKDVQEAVHETANWIRSQIGLPQQ